MAGHSNGDVRHLTVADPGILGKGHIALLVSGHDCWRYREIAPENLSLTLPFG
jgi:hypothetical protein